MSWWVASLQPAVIGAVLVWAAGVKLLSRHAPAAAARSALPRLVGSGRALPVYRGVAVVELVLGAALLLPPALRVEAVAAVAVTAGFLAYLGYARLTVPEASCGCMSARRAPVGVRSFARAAALLLASTAAVVDPAAWLEALAAQPVNAIAVIAAELAMVAALSPECDAYWLLPLRRLRVRLTHPLAGASDEVPLAATVQQLHRSGVYRQIARLLSSDVREHWDEGEWRIVCYAARFRGEDVTAVFAVPRLRDAPGAVRAALVDESTNKTMQAGWLAPRPAHAT